MDAAVALAKTAARITYADLPPEAVEATKKDILDTLGTAVAGSSAPGSREIVELMTEFGGPPESTIVMSGERVAAVNAAMANGVLGHALDFDDTHDAAILHVGVMTVPAAFAIAERKGKVSGKDFIAAVAMGIDVICRMGLANKEGPAGPGGWILTALYGYFGAAITVGMLLGLDEKKLTHAMGIAYAQASGNHQCIEDGALTKRMQIGFAARGGVMAALMAEKGITGAVNSLEGKSGLYHNYHGGDYDAGALTADLGKGFEVVNLSFKAYPCGRMSHTAIDAALALRKEHGIRPADVEEVTVTVNRPVEAHALCSPLELKRNPRTIVDAQFSIPYVVACALVKGKVGIDDFKEPAIRDASVLALASRVTPRYDPKMARRQIPPALVEVKTWRGIYSKHVDIPYGNPENPMDVQAIADKFRECCRLGVRPLPAGNVERVAELCSRLEELEDVAEVMRLVGGRGGG
ncbi:MAG: MmgE/PrpD family protein [Chloroflexi bacterium]|nr:MmgE/PrpD family protein [Chloroflexota bacterium]